MSYSYNRGLGLPGPDEPAIAPAKLQPTEVGGGASAVAQGLDKLLMDSRKALTVGQAGNYKKMFWHLIGVLDGVRGIGMAFEVDDVGYLMRVRKQFAHLSGARPTTNFSASYNRLSSLDRSKIQEALAYVHHWEAREQGADRKGRAEAAKEAISASGLNSEEAAVLLRSIHVSPSEIK